MGSYLQLENISETISEHITTPCLSVHFVLTLTLQYGNKWVSTRFALEVPYPTKLVPYSLQLVRNLSLHVVFAGKFLSSLLFYFKSLNSQIFLLQVIFASVHQSFVMEPVLKLLMPQSRTDHSRVKLSYFLSLSTCDSCKIIT